MLKRFLYLILAIGLIGFVYYLETRPKLNSNELILYGNVDIRQVDLGFRVSGRISEMPFQEGDYIEAGTLLAVLDPQPYIDQLKQTQAQILSTKASITNAKNLVKRRKELIDSGGISEQDVDDALTTLDVFQASLEGNFASEGIAKTNLHDTKLYSPSPGTILTRICEPGTVVKVADPIYTLSLFSPIWVRAFVNEKQLGLVFPDMPAEIYTDTPGSPVYKGHIGFISPVAEFTPKTVETTQLRTDLVYRLRVIVDNADLGLRQGMPVTVKLKLPEHRPLQFPTPQDIHD